MTTQNHPQPPLFLGTIEVTCDHVCCVPEPGTPAARTQLLIDFLSETAWEWVESDQVARKLQPAYLLAAVADGFFDELLDDDDPQRRARAREALSEGPYTGAAYAVSIKRIPGTAVQCCEIQPLAFRTGLTWRDPGGLPLAQPDREAAAQKVLAYLSTHEVWAG